MLIPALVGAGLGWALPVLLDWLLGLPWIPFGGLMSLIDSVPDEIALPVLIGLGLVAGVIFGLYALHEEQPVEKHIGNGRPVEGGKQSCRLTNRPDSLDA